MSGGGEGKRRTCAKGHYQPRPVRSSGHLTLLSGAGEGEVVSKKVGKEVRGACKDEWTLWQEELP